jgi:hypothetical protein
MVTLLTCRLYSAILKGDATLLKLVELLGPQLTSNDPFERANGKVTGLLMTLYYPRIT